MRPSPGYPIRHIGPFLLDCYRDSTVKDPVATVAESTIDQEISMITRKLPSSLAVFFGYLIFAAALASSATASNQQGSENGMPFRDISEQIDLLAIELADAVSALQGDIDQLYVDQADQDTLIAALQSAVATLEVRVSGAEMDIDTLQAMQNLQAQLIAELQNSVASLEADVAANAADIAALIAVDQNLQQLIAAIESQIQMTNARIDLNDGDISALQSQIVSLQAALATAQAQLAAKQDRVDGICAPGSSIREIFPNGNVVCEADTVSSGSGTLTSFRSSDTVNISSSTFVTRTVTNNRACTGSGYRAVGGGYSVSSHLGVGNVYRNYPTSNTNWRVTVRSDSTGSRTLTTYVVCARVL